MSIIIPVNKKFHNNNQSLWKKFFSSVLHYSHQKRVSLNNKNMSPEGKPKITPPPEVRTRTPIERARHSLMRRLMTNFLAATGSMNLAAAATETIIYLTSINFGTPAIDRQIESVQEQIKVIRAGQKNQKRNEKKKYHE